MTQYPRQPARYRPIDVFYYSEIGWEKDVEVALLNLYR